MVASDPDAVKISLSVGLHDGKNTGHTHKRISSSFLKGTSELALETRRSLWCAKYTLQVNCVQFMHRNGAFHGPLTFPILMFLPDLANERNVESS